MKTTGDQGWIDALSASESKLVWTLFAIGQVPQTFGFKDRVLNDHLVWYVADGCCEGLLPAQPLRMDAGSILWIPPGVTHSVWIPPRSKSMFAYSFRFRLRYRGREIRCKRAPILQHRRADLLPLIEMLYQDRCMLDDVRPAWIPEHSIKSLLALIYLRLIGGEQSPGTGNRESRRLSHLDRQRLLMYVRKNLNYRPSSADLAREMRLTPDYFSRIFRRSFGVSVRRWVLEERMREAAFRAPDSTVSIKELAHGLGYSDVNLFCRQFRQIMGKSPTEYRAAYTR